MSSDSTRAVVTAAVGTSVVATLLMFCFSPPVNAGQPEAMRVFTAQQATAGKAAFEKSCAACHMRDLSGDTDAPQLAGTQFRSTWRPRSTKDLFQYMSTSMPPGSAPLSSGDYASITAYILQANGAVAGTEVLSVTTAVPIDRVGLKK
jgi:mono/diheme cytochrome c family protein